MHRNDEVHDEVEREGQKKDKKRKVNRREEKAKLLTSVCWHSGLKSKEDRVENAVS